MLSILIPSYNYNITRLVSDLHQQAMEAMVDFEIIVMEDGSNLFLEENKTVSELEFCRYIPLTKNIGRSAIRNRLADEAKYEHLLFMDCDAEISSNCFIQKYLPFYHDECVVLGGRTYEESIDPRHSLLAKYGKQRERNDIEGLKKRKKHQVFTSPNFLISKLIFYKVRFNESIKGYGHEDTIFGIMLQRNNIEFKYIDNPVVHIGIEDNPTFIDKTEKALHNLYTLYNSREYPELEKESKILSYYIRLKQYYFTSVILFGFKIFKKLIRKNLLSPNPSLLLFDFYKLGIFCSFSSIKRI